MKLYKLSLNISATNRQLIFACRAFKTALQIKLITNYVKINYHSSLPTSRNNRSTTWKRKCNNILVTQKQHCSKNFNQLIFFHSIQPLLPRLLQISYRRLLMAREPRVYWSIPYAPRIEEKEDVAVYSGQKRGCWLFQ